MGSHRQELINAIVPFVGGKYQGETLSFFAIQYYYQVEDKVSHKCPATSDTKICVHHGDLKPVKMCHGDSGGPLLVNQGGMGVLIGVASYSPLPISTCPQNATSCALPGNCDKSGLAVFTKIQAFLPWIKNITGTGEHQTLICVTIFFIFKTKVI